MNLIDRCLPGVVAAVLSLPAVARPEHLPAPDSPEFCVAVQKILASTDMEGSNTLFTDMQAFRASKPAPDPLLIYQVVSYRGQLPVMVSCKVKTAAHLRAVYGEDAAGEQHFCPEVTRRVLDAAVVELREENPAAAAKAAEFIVDDNEPYIAGGSYLSEFELSYVGEDGAVHLQSPGLYQNYDHWITRFLPERFQGQSYCHLPTVNYIKAVAMGTMPPGTVMSAEPDAPVTPY